AARLQVPVYTRRSAQGALPEDDALAVRGAWKKPFTGRADVVLVVGFKFWSGEHFGEPPTWNADATYIQADAAPSRVGWHVRAEIPIVGDPKLVLRQLGELADRHRISRKPSAWVAEVARVRGQFEQALQEQEKDVRERTPIHPARLTRDLLEVMAHDAT